MLRVQIQVDWVVLFGVVLEASPFLRASCGLMVIIRQSPVFPIDAKLQRDYLSADIFRMYHFIFLISNLGRREEASSSSPSMQVAGGTGQHFYIVIGILLSNCRVTAAKFVSCLLPVSLALFKLQGHQHMHKPHN